jgi:hypothetical protein
LLKRRTFTLGPLEHNVSYEMTKPETPIQDHTWKSEDQSVWTPTVSKSPRTKAEIAETKIGSRVGSPTKPEFMRSGSWHLKKDRVSHEARRAAIPGATTHYSHKHGKMKMKGKVVPWNNRWHLSPTVMGAEIHQNYREYFDLPSRMYTAATDSWRHMYGDGCEMLNTRPTGAKMPRPVYGWHSLRLQDVVQAPDRPTLEVVDGPFYDDAGL